MTDLVFRLFRVPALAAGGFSCERCDGGLLATGRRVRRLFLRRDEGAGHGEAADAIDQRRGGG